MPKDQFEFKVMAKKLAEFKDNNKLTFQDIGDATGVDKSHVLRIMRMESYPSLPFLIRLAKFMKKPLYFLFIPTEENERQEFSNKINLRLNELGYNIDKLSTITEIPTLRMMDIAKGNSSTTGEERERVLQVLDLTEETDFQEVKLNLIESFLNDLNLNESKRENIIQYIKDNLI